MCRVGKVLLVTEVLADMAAHHILEAAAGVVEPLLAMLVMPEVLAVAAVAHPLREQE
jgi:hypothetical protein